MGAETEKHQNKKTSEEKMIHEEQQEDRLQRSAYMWQQGTNFIRSSTPVSSMQEKLTSKRKYQFGTTCIRKKERNLQGHVVAESDVRADKREF